MPSSTPPPLPDPNEVTFREGATIRLKTGGPPMTVTGTNEFARVVFCSWFKDDALQQGQFPFDSVESIANVQAVERPKGKSPQSLNTDIAFGATGVIASLVFFAHDILYGSPMIALRLVFWAVIFGFSIRLILKGVRASGE